MILSQKHETELNKEYISRGNPIQHHNQKRQNSMVSINPRIHFYLKILDHTILISVSHIHCTAIIFLGSCQSEISISQDTIKD